MTTMGGQGTRPYVGMKQFGYIIAPAGSRMTSTLRFIALPAAVFCGAIGLVCAMPTAFILAASIPLDIKYFAAELARDCERSQLLR